MKNGDPSLALYSCLHANAFIFLFPSALEFKIISAIFGAGRLVV
jgi:hypothetical protein